MIRFDIPSAQLSKNYMCITGFVSPPPFLDYLKTFKKLYFLKKLCTLSIQADQAHKKATVVSYSSDHFLFFGFWPQYRLAFDRC